MKKNIIKIPFDKGGMARSKGSSKAPEIITKYLKDLYLDESGKKTDYSIKKLKNITSLKDIYSQLKIYKDDLKGSIFLGGDHSITYPIFKTIKEQFKDIYLIIFDAHPDLIKDFKEPTHESFLRELIDQKIISPSHTQVIGIRNWDIQEKKYLDNKKINYLTMKDISNTSQNSIKEQFFTGKDIYLSIDIDIIDPVQAIGTGYIEHGGMSSRQLINYIQFLKDKNNIIASDIVEVNPQKDIKDITSSLAAKILKELL